LEAELILFESNQRCENQFYTSRINFDPPTNETKHTLIFNILIANDKFFLGVM